MFKDGTIIRNYFLINGLFELNSVRSFECNILNVHDSIGTKRCIINEHSSKLWHKRLGHISIERIKRLVKDKVLTTLDFTDFGAFWTA